VAEVARHVGLGEQILLVMGLRWRLFRNGLQGLTAKLSLIGSIFIGIVWTVIALGAGVAIAVGSYYLIENDQTQFLVAILWGIFVFWQVFPILSAQFAPSFDSTSLLRFPLKFSSFFVLNLAYGFADPAGLCGLVWHLCMWIGVTSARPDLWLLAALVLFLSAAVNLFFSRMLYAWLERLLAQRRTREILFAVFILVMVCFQFSGMIVQRWAKPVGAFMHETSYVWSTLPTGQAGVALQFFLDRSTGPGLLACAIVLAYSAGFAGLLAYRLHAEYLGETFSETAAPTRIAKKVSTAPRAITAAPSASQRVSVGSTWFSGPVSAIFIKEIRYLYRNSIAAVSLLMPLIIVGAITMNSRAATHGKPNPFSKMIPSGLAYPGAVAYSLLILLQYSMNSLAYEGGGVQFLYLAPIEFSTVMLGKNLFQLAILGLEAALAWILIAMLAGPPPFVMLLSTWIGVLFVALINMMAGNWLSLQFPRKFEFGMRTRRVSGLSSLASFGLYFSTLGAVWGIGLLVAWLAGIWFVPVAYAVLSIAALSVYLHLLKATSQQAIDQRETIIGQLVR
jgi:ABC-2 type transport system permease protein